jgi:hypothetical protein
MGVTSLARSSTAICAALSYPVRRSRAQRFDLCDARHGVHRSGPVRVPAAGLHALGGPKHGGVAARVEALLQEIKRPALALSTVRSRLARGEEIPGFGHPLYAAGDPRAGALFSLADGLPRARSSLAPWRTANSPHPTSTRGWSR